MYIDNNKIYKKNIAYLKTSFTDLEQVCVG